MKKIIKMFLLVFVLCVFYSCNSYFDDHYLQGTWLNEEGDRGHQIVFEQGEFHQTISNDDLVNKSKGKYFLNKNPLRSQMTISLIPDIIISEGDTIILENSNLDVVKLSDSIMFVRLPTRWVHETPNSTKRVNRMIKYVKLR